MAKRSRCLVCGELTNTARYVALRWPMGAVAQLQWYHRRICENCEVPDELIVKVEGVLYARSPPRYDDTLADL